MINEARQFFLNRFKLGGFLSVLGLLFLPSIGLAQQITSVTGVALTPANPAPGTSATVNWSYAESSASNNPRFFILVSNTATIQPAGTAGQSIVMGDGCVPVAQVNGGCVIGSNVPVGTDTYSTSITIPSGLAPGTWYVTVVMNDYYVGLNPNLSSNTVHGQTTFTVPLPATSCTLTNTVGSTTTAPGGLILYTLNYSFVNTTSFTLTDPVPANTTYYSSSPGGGLIGSTVSWNIYSGSAANTITGTAWVLLSVNAGASGTISDIATGTTSSTFCTGSAPSVTVQNPTLTLTKTESATTLPAGSTITYLLGWMTSGLDLEFYDSYNNATGDTNSAIVGYDNTAYYQNAAVDGDLGSWNVVADAQGNNYIIGNVLNNPGHNPNGNNDFPELLRSLPGVNICGGFTVQGDVQIPVTAWGAAGGGDIDMVVAMNPSAGITITAGLSIDNNPNYFFFQKNQEFNGSIYPTPLGSNCLFGTCWPSNTSPVTAGSWYTINVNVEFTGSGPITYIANVWPQGDPAADGTPITWIDANTAAADTNDPGTISGCSCGWEQGWQAAGTAGTNYFSNLQVYAGGPVSNYSITDAIPAGITYVGSNPTATGWPAGPLVWTNSASVIDGCPVTWWGTVGCTALPINNSFTMNASNVTNSGLTSNTVNLTVNGCNTATNTATTTATSTPTATSTNTVPSTPTATGTNTATSTPPVTSTFTNTVTNTITQTPTNTPTVTPTFTITQTATNTPTSTITNTPIPTSTWTPSPTATPGLYAWPNPFNPKFGNGNFMIGFVPAETTADFYTVSGERVQEIKSQSGGTIYWDGTNKVYMPVSTGIYIYIVKNSAGTVILSGKVLLVRN
jgi:hypothetical protein